MEDQFIREHIEDLLRNIRTQVLVKLIRPYTRVHIAFISQVSSASDSIGDGIVMYDWLIHKHTVGRKIFALKFFSVIAFNDEN